MRKITALLASSVLLVAACGGDDDDSAGAVQNDAADEFIQQMKDEDVNPDEECVRTAFADMSDLLNMFIESLPEGIDGDCVRDKLSGADLGDIASSSTLPPEVEQAMTDCGTG